MIVLNEFWFSFLLDPKDLSGQRHFSYDRETHIANSYDT